MNIRISTLSLAWLLLIAPCVSAQAITWSVVLGEFNRPESWTPNVAPSASTTAIFSQSSSAGSYFAFFDSSVTIASLIVTPSSNPTTFWPDSSTGQTIVLTNNGSGSIGNNLSLNSLGSSTFSYNALGSTAITNHAELTVTAGTFFNQLNNNLFVGDSSASPGTMRVQAGGLVRLFSGANFLAAAGRIIVEGENARFIAMHDAQSAVPSLVQHSQLDIRPGGLASLRDVSLSANSFIRIAGGTLEIDRVLPVLLASEIGSLHFESGTLHFRHATGLDTAAAYLGGGINLSAGKSLIVNERLRVGANSFLGLNGGTLNVGQLQVEGFVFGSGTLNLATQVQDNLIHAQGTIAARVTGNSESEIRVGSPSTISGITLVIGNAASVNGYDFPGILTIGSNHAVLLDSNRAQLGISTTLGQNGLLSAPNGINLGVGQTLSAAGNALINGEFTNNGVVHGPTGTMFLSFNDNVDGAGSYTGNIAFLQEFNPGNSPGVIDFAGNLSFGPASTLNIEISSLTSFDQLLVSGDAFLSGTLKVTALDGYQPVAGDAFTIVEIGGTRSGTFANASEGHLFHLGGDFHLQLSYMGGGGNDVVLTAVAIPEPSAILLGAVPVAAWWLRRRFLPRS